MDTKTEFNLNNIIVTLSLISISSVKKFACKCPQTWSQLRSMNAKAGKHRHSEPCGIDVTISARYNWSVARQLISFPLRHWNLRNLTLQQETGMLPYTEALGLFSVLKFARLYNAAASPASRLRSAGSFASSRGNDRLGVRSAAPVIIVVCC